MPRKSMVRLTDRPDMTLDVYRGRKTTTQQQQSINMPVPYVGEVGYTNILGVMDGRTGVKKNAS